MKIIKTFPGSPFVKNGHIRREKWCNSKIDIQPIILRERNHPNLEKIKTLKSITDGIPFHCTRVAQSAIEDWKM